MPLKSASLGDAVFHFHGSVRVTEAFCTCREARRVSESIRSACNVVLTNTSASSIPSPHAVGIGDAALVALL